MANCLVSFFQLMMLVDYGGSIFPIIAHSPWNGLHLADFVMPFFLFIAGVSPALVYKVNTDSSYLHSFDLQVNQFSKYVILSCD